MWKSTAAARKGFLVVDDVRHLTSALPEPDNRYALGTKNKTLKFNPDGSLTIYLGNESPGKDKEANRLPAPSGNFSIWLRAYWPDQAILDGTWKPPVILRIANRAIATVESPRVRK